MNLRRKNSRGKMIIVLLILLVLVGIGYATIGSNVVINGSSNIDAANWDVHFENVHVKNGSVAIDTENNEQAATINQNGDTVSYTVRLIKPGDFYEFTVDVVNDGVMDAMVDSVVSKYNNTVITTGIVPAYLDYSITYGDGTAIAANDLLETGQKDRFKVRLWYRDDIEASLLPETSSVQNFSFTVNYIQAANGAVARISRDFATDSWTVIANQVKNGNEGIYELGATRTIDLGTLGTHIVRIINNTTPDECYLEGFSQSSCGLVLEFVDPIGQQPWGDGEWAASDLYNYLQTTVYNSFPSDLKESIIDTYNLSSHCVRSTTNSTCDSSPCTLKSSTDKIYLLSPFDIFGSSTIFSEWVCYSITYNVENSSNSKRMDYYNNLGITASDCSGNIKKNADRTANLSWWTRFKFTGSSSGSSLGGYVNNSGQFRTYSGMYSSTTEYVYPVFRIG